MSSLPPLKKYTGKKRGRKKGSVLEMINISTGGDRGGQVRPELRNESMWCLDADSDNEYSMSSDSDEEEELGGEESDDTEDEK